VGRRLPLKSAARDVGERLLTSKLQILNGTGNRRPGMALSLLTGRVADQFSELDSLYESAPALAEAPEPAVVQPARAHLLARTVYLTESHVRDIEAIIEAWQPSRSRRLTRSAVLRRAIEHLRSAVDADPAKFLLEGE
jgi:hypothetical protein